MDAALLCGVVYTGFILPICWYDSTRLRIPNLLSGGVFASLLLLQLLRNPSPGIVLCTVSAAGPVLLLVLLNQITGGGIGLGDVKLSASTGLLLPGFPWIPALTASAIIGLIVVVPLYLAGKIDRKTRIPFAPFLGAGTMLIWTLSLSRLDPVKGW